MKYYWKGILFLVLILMFLLLLKIESHRYLKDSKDVLKQLKDASEINKITYDLIDQDLLANRLMMQGIDPLLESWKPFLTKCTEPNKVLNEMVELSFSNTLAVAEKTAQRLRENDNGVLKESIFVSLKVVGKFERIYTWLGAIEEAYPHAKISELHLTAENMNAALTLSIQLPILI